MNKILPVLNLTLLCFVQIAAIKAKKAAEAEDIARLADQHFEHERMRLERENVRQLRAAAQRKENGGGNDDHEEYYEDDQTTILSIDHVW